MKGRNVQLPAVHVSSQRGACGVHGARGAVFRDIVYVHGGAGGSQQGEVADGADVVFIDTD